MYLMLYAPYGRTGVSMIQDYDSGLLRYVPVRRPWTICVQERLPPNVAGALLNQTDRKSVV